jgi:hypothetical protein
MTIRLLTHGTDHLALAEAALFTIDHSTEHSTVCKMPN